MVKPYKSNLDAIRHMSSRAFAMFIEDAINYDNPDSEWRSNLMPPLPFESWSEWLDRRAIYATDK